MLPATIIDINMDDALLDGVDSKSRLRDPGRHVFTIIFAIFFKNLGRQA